MNPDLKEKNQNQMQMQSKRVLNKERLEMAMVDKPSAFSLQQESVYPSA